MHYISDLDKINSGFVQAKNEGRLEQFTAEVIPQLVRELKETRMEVVDLRVSRKPITVNNSDNMDTVAKMLQESAKAEEVFNALCTTQSMSEVADTVDSLSESMAKLVLKKFVYSQG